MKTETAILVGIGAFFAVALKELWDQAQLEALKRQCDRVYGAPRDISAPICNRYIAKKDEMGRLGL